LTGGLLFPFLGNGGDWFLLFPSFDSFHTLVRNLFNPQLLISHLTNSNGCGNL
jgi:hypothetical protein